MMDENVLRMMAAMLPEGTFPEHGFKVGDRVRMVDIDAHDFELAEELMQNGEQGTVIHTERFLGIMPVFEVRPDNGKTVEYEGELIDRVPFSKSAFHTVIKIEEAE